MTMSLSLMARSSMRSLSFGVVAMVFLAAGCNSGPKSAQTDKPIEVIVTTPITDEITDYQDFTGRLDAQKTVEIRARVSGYVTQVPFKEGDLVREGDLLFQIDPLPYDADLNQAEANLRVAETDAKLTEKIAVRGQRLIGSGSLSREEYEQNVAAMEKSQATVAAMKAARDRARLYKDYTRVTSPLSGRVSRRFVDPGNLVNADMTLLTTIVSQDPMYAYFDVDERTYLDLLDAASANPSSQTSDLQFPVLLRLANEEKFSRAGTVDFVDNRVNAGTGTIRMRGIFQNPSGYLKSGLFVRIRLPIGDPYKALLIPDEALLSDQGKKYLYVVDDKNTVVYRSVKLGQALEGLRVIKEGLSPGERVIVSGMQRVRPDPNVQVQAKMRPPPQRPESPLGKLLSSSRPSVAKKPANADSKKPADKEATKPGEPAAGGN
jgi:RND family efflux transporter MFP subunit